MMSSRATCVSVYFLFCCDRDKLLRWNLTLLKSMFFMGSAVLSSICSVCYLTSSPLRQHRPPGLPAV